MQSTRLSGGLLLYYNAIRRYCVWQRIMTATLLIVVVTILFPLTLLAELLGFQPLPMIILLVIGMIVVVYMIAAQITKKSKRVNMEKDAS